MKKPKAGRKPKKDPTVIVDDTFAIRCFRNGKRMFTHQLSKFEARVFRNTARHLSRYLGKTYRLGRFKP